MIDIIMERTFRPAITIEEVFGLAASAEDCFGLYKIDWVESFLSGDGGAMICHFQAPDLESLRQAARQTTGKIPPLWQGTLHHAPRAVPPPADRLNDILVARRFDHPVALDDIQAIEDAGAWCLETYNVHFVRTLFSRDRKRMICLYRAPDAEAVRAAQRKAGVPFETLWDYRHLTPENRHG